MSYPLQDTALRKWTANYFNMLHNMLNAIYDLKTNLGLGREDCQQAVIDDFLCMVAGCALGTDVYHWMF